MTRGLLFESDNKICRRCSIKCDKVVPFHDRHGVLVGGEMEKAGMRSESEIFRLNMESKCGKKSRGVFGGVWMQQVLERVASGEVVLLNQEILYKIRDTVNKNSKDSWQDQLDKNDWLTIGILCNRGGAEPFGEYTDMLKRLSLINGLGILSVSIESEEGEMKTIWERKK